MPPLLQFIIRRVFAALASLIIITMVLYAGIMLTPPEARASIYFPPGKGGERMTEAGINVLIRKYHLDEPYLVQYGYWVRSLLNGTWGYSPTMREDVLPALLHRTPATLELAFYSLLVFIPLGLIAGLASGWRSNSTADGIFRGAAFLATSIPPFIMAMFLMAVFYLKLEWFAPGRMGVTTGLDMAKTGFVDYTGLMTIDTLINGRLDLWWEALRHLAMPVITLSLFHWATLGRITRTLIIHQKQQDYILSARARGLSERKLAWRHALRAILAPALTTTALSAASIMTSIFIVEIIFGITGVSQVVVMSMESSPDAPAAMGFAVYSVLMVIGLMLLLDVIQALVDPRVRDEVLRS